MDIPPTAELVANGLAGLLLGGAIVRQFLISLAEARTKAKGGMLEAAQNTAPLVTGIAIGWSADQIERALQALESIAGAAAFYSDSTRSKTEDVLQKLLEHLERAEEEQTRRPRR